MARLYIGNLSYESTEDELRSFFEFGGHVVSGVKICTDRVTGRPRGFGFVDFPGSASEAVAQFDGQELGGRTLRIREALEKPQGRSDRQADRDLLP